MTHRHELLVRRMYAAINQRNMADVRAAFAPDAVWHGSGAHVQGVDAITAMVSELIEAADGTLQIELHDVLANDDHAVALQVTRARRGERELADRVVYVYHLSRDQITEATFVGDPRTQDDFWT